MRTATLILAGTVLLGCAPRPDMASQRAAIDAADWAAAELPLVVMDIPARETSAVLGLVGTNAGARSWGSADRRGITETGGVILRSAGFGHDLMATDPAPVRAAMNGGAKRYTREFRHLTADNQIVASRAECQMASPVTDSTTVVGQARVAQKWQETCSGDAGSFTNTYWRAGGTTIKTEQWLSQQLGSVTVEYPTD